MDQEQQRPAVQIEHVSKTFRLPRERQNSLKSLLINFKKRGYELQDALDDVTFDVQPGEFFGIVGRNGSGKSTLLKIIAGIYTPTSGQVKVNGSLTPFIELGVGFNPELSGRENVFLNGALLGFNRKQMKAMYHEIVKFAELERFMDQKLKNYSSGMQVRLAFSIATRAQSDILLLDEVLAVGDGAFQQKCYDYFAELKRQKKTIILVSHNMPIIEKYCERALLMDAGRIQKIDSSEVISTLYDEMFLKEEAARRKEAQPKADDSPVKVHSLEVRQNGKVTKKIKAGQAFEVTITVSPRIDVEEANIGINIKNIDRIMVISTDTLVTIGKIKLTKGRKQSVTFRIENVLTDGVYFINAGVADETAGRVLLRAANVGDFIVSGTSWHAKALAHPGITASLGDSTK